jgi:hypothetical protein
MQANKKTVEISYSYPTSPNAIRFGCKLGCYPVAIVGEKGKLNYVAAFETWAKAKAYADGLALPFNRYSMKEVA